MLTFRAISGAVAMAMGAATVLAMPGFSPEADASTPAQVVDSVPLKTSATDNDCSQQAWPYYRADCLHDRAHGPARTVRIVTTDRVSK